MLGPSCGKQARMATDTGLLDYVAQQLDLGSRLGHKRLFGGYSLYLDAKVVAFVCANSL